MSGRVWYIGILYFVQLQDIHAQFIQAGKEIGIDHYHKSNELLGGGVAFFDYDNDGFEDLILTGGAFRERLFKNLGDGTFHDVSRIAGLDQVPIAYSSGVSIGDINNDGCDDIFVTTLFGYSNQLLLNSCDGTFSDISTSAGIEDNHNSSSSAFIDFNEDGYLDIYIGNYVENSRLVYNENGHVIGFDHDCFPNLLYINQGNETFVERGDEYGVNNEGCTLAVAATDINQDGHADLYIANDFGEWILPNEVYLNISPGNKLTAAAKQLQLDQQMYGMGIAVGDADNNLLADYYITNLGKNLFNSQETTISFQEKSDTLGISNEYTRDGRTVTSWGTFFFDFDNDADLDLFVSNGSVTGLSFLNTATQDPDKLFENMGLHGFESLTTFDQITSYQSNRGAAFSDFDNDGDLDICSVSVGVNDYDDAQTSFYINKLNNEQNWVSFKLIGTLVNKNGYGASIRLFSSGAVFRKELYSGGSYCSQSSQQLHFGLGTLNQIDSVVVQWDSESLESFSNIPINEKIRLEQGNPLFFVAGCMDQRNANYNPKATFNSGCSYNPRQGCTDPFAINYDVHSIIEDGSCTFSVLGIGESPIELDVYPNHFSDFINISVPAHLSQLLVMIFDINGGLQYKKELQRVSDVPLRIATDHLKKGMYFMTLSNKRFSKTTKVVKR